jgi:hypothetical protein
VDDIIFDDSSHVHVSSFQEMMEEFLMSMMGELTFFRYPSQVNKARYLRTSGQVHEGPGEEVQHGRAQVRVYTDEHDNVIGSR